MIYIVNGYPGCGKTTFEHMVQTLMEPMFCPIFSTIDYVKDCAETFGWKGGKSPKDRQFLSDLKQALAHWNDSPYQETKEFIDDKLQEWKRFGINLNKTAIFIDCREPQEIQRFVDDYGARTIFIDRKVDNSNLSNNSDKNVENYHYDIIIDNNGTELDLYYKADEFINNEGLYPGFHEFQPNIFGEVFELN